MPEATPRVVATDAARDLIATLRAKHGPLMFHQSGGCCDGSSPMCYALGEFMVGGADVLLGDLEGCPFYMGEDQFAYWEHTQLIIDAVPGRGGAFAGQRRGPALPAALAAVLGRGMGERGAGGPGLRTGSATAQGQSRSRETGSRAQSAAAPPLLARRHGIGGPGLLPLERDATDARGAELGERTAARHGRAAQGTAGVLHC